MPVAGVQRQIVLEDEGGDPHIVGRNRSPLLAELAVNRRVVVSGLLVRKRIEPCLIRKRRRVRSFAGPCNPPRSRPKLGQNGEGNEHCLSDARASPRPTPLQKST